MILTADVFWLPGFSLISRDSGLLVEEMAMDAVRMEREMDWEECCGRKAVQWEQATLLVGMRLWQANHLVASIIWNPSTVAGVRNLEKHALYTTAGLCKSWKL